ncbi:MAG: aldehyde ferredoxin oxidoreductase [Zestosphaera tikiterensis]|uniref:Aldehyde ferredoxin oxidoreductase n=1 Tax=Zestosphaera tikiterensis TaxID=1973259 RepID=A0A2R7Y854_9CREN|nr:MAG: aldehyde ferredoxin oxidoreductase [Zestosphaera tikiterensis]
MVDLTRKSYYSVDIPSDTLRAFIGGRGLAAKLLWDLNQPGVNPLSPENHLIFAVGPLTGYPVPSSGKMLIASKSPLTGGYGDGNIGTRAAVEMRKTGYDAIVVKGASDKPTVLFITCKSVEFHDAEDLWGKGTRETEKKLKERFGSDVSVLSIGPAGENKVLYATVISEHGRSGGRPGMGAVMGSKKLKAVVFKGCEMPEPSNKRELLKAATEAYNFLKSAPAYEFWVRQGTMGTIVWSQKNSALPTYNFREAVFDDYEGISGDIMEKMKVASGACPMCNMPCRNYVEYSINGTKDVAEPDYENVAMLGSNIGIGNLAEVSHLNNVIDDYGMDTISTGNVLGYVMELSEKKLIKDYTLEWGDFRKALEAVKMIALREGFGNLMADGVMRLSRYVGGEAQDFAMHVKGLEISAYDCHAAPGMALAYGTSSIGAHHKDAWFISLEINMGRDLYNEEKPRRLVLMQNIRGGLFESFVSCRLPWVELGLDIQNYVRFIRAATGVDFTWDELMTVAQRIYSLVRAFWVREFKAEGKSWGRYMDIPPARWFKEPLTKGPLSGAKVDFNGYNFMLDKYYELRGWNSEGIPKKETLEKLGLDYVASTLYG